MKLNNCEIWESSGCLYIKNSKGIIVKLTGESVYKVKMVIKSLVVKEPLSDNVQIVDSEVKEVLMLLANLGVIQEDEKKDIFHSKIGVYADGNILEAMKSHLPGFDIELIQDIADIKNYNLLVVILSCHLDYVMMAEIGDRSYREQVPLLFCEFSAVSFTIGPLILPKQHTPSLNCYLKRRTVNAKSPELFAEMISRHSVTLLKSEFEDYHYYKIYLTLLCEEISKFMKFDGNCSKHLVGMSVTINFITYEIEKSRVLKDPMSKLFTRTPFIPFNG